MYLGHVIFSSGIKAALFFSESVFGRDLSSPKLRSRIRKKSGHLYRSSRPRSIANSVDLLKSYEYGPAAIAVEGPALIPMSFFLRFLRDLLIDGVFVCGSWWRARKSRQRQSSTK